MKWMRDNALGVYISIPFCRSKCTYCNFSSGVYPASQHERYVQRLIEDLAGAGDWAARSGVKLPMAIDTVYLGGGTPSLLAPELIHNLFSALRAEFDLLPGAEITMECAPGQISGPTLDAMAAVGVNRVSFGVQSFIDREAHESGRLHSRAVVFDDLLRLRAAGITNLNVDLIAGLAGQTYATWNESLRVLLDCDLPHASVYMLEVDEDSRLGREMLSGGARYHAGLVPTDDAIARMYEVAIETLATGGLSQYEISNFSRPGAESQHNLRYWLRRPYLGLGLDASSMAMAAGAAVDRQALRWKTTDDLDIYLEDRQPVESAWQSHEAQLEEAWFLGLRLNEGVNVGGLETEFGQEQVAPTLTVVSRLSDDGLLMVDRDRVRLTPRGRLMSNLVFAEFLDVERSPSAVSGVARA